MRVNISLDEPTSITPLVSVLNAYHKKETCHLISGIFISPLVEIYGCRVVVMSFCFLYATAIALPPVAPTVGSLYVILGVLTGKDFR